MAPYKEVNLDWRYALTPSQMVTKIDQLFKELNIAERAVLRLGFSRAKGAIAFRLDDEGVMRFIRYDNASPRAFEGYVEYWMTLFQFGMFVCDMQGNRQPMMKRLVQYRESQETVELNAIERYVVDLALTIEVHPFALGIKPEVNGKVTIPEGHRISTVVIKNIIQYHAVQPGARHQWQKTEYLNAGTREIPTLVASLGMFYAKGQERHVRAVIVVEHRNVSDVLQGSMFTDMIVVMTAGYPAWSTSEFLHMLCIALPDTPFYYFGDLDLQGFQIFDTLKYGCTASAWASKIMCCPRLRWSGPTIKEFLDQPVVWRQRWERVFKAGRPHMTDEQVEEAGDRWQQQMMKKHTKKGRALNKKDWELIRGIEARGILMLEPGIKAQIAQMKTGASKFRLAVLTICDLNGIEKHIKRRITEFEREEAEEEVEGDEEAMEPEAQEEEVEEEEPSSQLIQRSPLGRRFMQLTSQDQGHSEETHEPKLQESELQEYEASEAESNEYTRPMAEKRILELLWSLEADLSLD